MADNSSGTAFTDVLLLSDSDKLLHQIMVVLRGRWSVQAYGADDGESCPGQKPVPARAIVLALVEPAYEPVAVLLKHNLLGQVGEVPLIIISPDLRHSQPLPVARIWYLGFPCDWQQLTCLVDEVLRERQACGGSVGS